MTTPRDMPPLAFIYDRIATPSRGVLNHRLAACREYALERREVVGEWIDEGDCALTDHGRLQLDALLRALADAARTRRATVLLVHDWGRLAHTAGPNASMRYKVALAGGWTETTARRADPNSGQAASGAA